MKRLVGSLLLVSLAAGGGWLGWRVWQKLGEESAGSGPKPAAVRAPVPVAVAPIERGRIVARQVFSGSLEASAAFVLATEVGGRLESLRVRLGDSVQRGAPVARIDPRPFQRALDRARAEAAVTRAREAEARSAERVAVRTLERVEELHGKGVESDARLDEIQAQRAVSAARLQVAAAEVTRAEAIVAAAELDLERTEVRVAWEGEDAARLVAERAVDPGHTVAPGDTLLRIVRIDPIRAVFFASERDFSALGRGQAVAISTDAWPGESFAGRIERTAPGFRNDTRQVRIEVEVPNSEGRLRPGMFVRVVVETGRADEAVVVPLAALARRQEGEGVFLIEKAAGRAEPRARWVPVRTGLRERDRVQLLEFESTGQVVTMGQSLLETGSAVRVVDPAPLGAGTPGRGAGE